MSEKKEIVIKVKYLKLLGLSFCISTFLLMTYHYTNYSDFHDAECHYYASYPEDCQRLYYVFESPITDGLHYKKTTSFYNAFEISSSGSYDGTGLYEMGFNQNIEFEISRFFWFLFSFKLIYWLYAFFISIIIIAISFFIKSFFRNYKLKIK